MGSIWDGIAKTWLMSVMITPVLSTWIFFEDYIKGKNDLSKQERIGNVIGWYLGILTWLIFIISL